MENRLKILDCHVHYALPVAPAQLERTLADTGTDMANLVVVPHRWRISSTPDALVYKYQYPGTTYVFTALDVSNYMRFPKAVGKKMASYAARMRRAGCDGVKMIEGKPDMRKTLPIPDFDDAVWEPFWRYAEQTALPILWHVNDPQEYWDDAIPEFAKESGWHYGPDTIHYEEQYRQVDTVMQRHPNLKIIFAHMYFMSAQLDRLAALMEQYPNMCVDLTPGIELYVNLSRNKAAAVEFLTRFQDRVLYGTDIGARAVLPGKEAPLNDAENAQRVAVCRGFLMGDRPFTVAVDNNFLMGEGQLHLQGMGLARDIQQKILHDNFVRLVGGPPQPVQKRLVLKECHRLRIMLKVMTYIEKDFVPDYTTVDYATAFFREAR